MGEILQTNVFFFITAIAAVSVTVVVMVVLYRLARFLKKVERISQIVEEELYILRDDIAEARQFARSEGIKLKHMLGFISVLFTLGQKMKGRTQRPRGRAAPGGREKYHDNTEKNNDDE